MAKTDKEVLELCKEWFEDIMERSDRLTSGNVSHGSRAIHGTAKSYAEYVGEHLKTKNNWKPTEEQLLSLKFFIERYPDYVYNKELDDLYNDLKAL